MCWVCLDSKYNHQVLTSIFVDLGRGEGYTGNFLSQTVGIYSRIGMSLVNIGVAVIFEILIIVLSFLLEEWSGFSREHSHSWRRGQPLHRQRRHPRREDSARFSRPSSQVPQPCPQSSSAIATRQHRLTAKHDKESHRGTSRRWLLLGQVPPDNGRALLQQRIVSLK